MEKVAEILLATVCVVLIVCALTYLFMIAWNYVMPDLFGLKTITFLQALALSFVAECLIKSTLRNKK